MKKNPFDHVNQVTYQKNDNFDKSSYIPILINKSLSFNISTLFHANMMNLNHNLPERLQYDYYFHVLPQQRIQAKWVKEEKIKDIEYIMEYYNYSYTKAKEALDVLNDDQIKTIKKRLDKGG